MSNEDGEDNTSLFYSSAQAYEIDKQEKERKRKYIEDKMRWNPNE